ncbi:MAG: hypothetical protein K2M34_03400 [Alphaproteobacteria bacterium]|nr:hypothetical protein [Alphaproteobacteria bacterium]
MKIKMCIFGKIVSCIALGAVMGGAYISLPAYAVVDNTGCDNENNLYINPDLALCSTHVYNIGKIENPSGSAERQVMQDVVALKTTLMTQQMYSQYEILATTVKRLRTQLQKEVLLAKLKSASATANGGSYNDSTSGSSSAGKDKYVVLANAENCLQTTNGDQILALQCVQRNLGRVNEAIASGNTGDAKRQLKQDLAVAKGVGFYSGKCTKSGKEMDCYPEEEIEPCKNLNNAKKEEVSNCATQYNFRIGNKLREMQQRSSAQQRNSGY